MHARVNAAHCSTVLHRLKMMGKIRYICTACGNGFTTRSATHRHVTKVEQGKGMVVTEASYRTGLATGIYFPVFPGKPPRYEKKPASPASKTPQIEIMEEFNRGFWRRAGELFCEEAFKDESKKAAMRMQIQLLLLDQTRKIMAERPSE